MAPERPGPEDQPVPVALSTNNSITIPVTLLQIKEGDGASEIRSEDDDLTSLTWLQDKNLLKGINLRTAGAGVQESPTSDYVDDSTSERDSSCSSVNSGSATPPPASTAATPAPAVKNKHPHHIPYDPQIHTTSKPPYSFSCLIFMAIEESPVKALPVKEIYNWILDHFPFYKNAPTGWKNSVRHNLSLNKCFRKVDKAPNLGKGSLWMVDPLYRSNLLTALQKAPYHPCSSLDTSSAPSSATTSFRKIHTPVSEDDGDTGAAGEIPKSPSGKAGGGGGGGRLPDPSLFPYLARRLAAVEGSGPLDDVDAAAAMLELKHGPLRRDEYHRRLGAQMVQNVRGAKRKNKNEIKTEMLITSSPSEDHTYSSAEPSAPAAAPAIKSEPASPDEAFQEGSDSDSSWNTLPIKAEEDIEEQRKIAEGADALLNLAGITTQTQAGITTQVSVTTPLKRSLPRLLRKPSPRWRTENNNVIETELYRPPAKIRRKSLSASGKNLKFKR